MANFTKQFQDEVRRLVRKEIKEDLQQLRKQNAQQRREIAALKRSVAALESTTKRVKKIADAKREEDLTPEESEVERARISSKTTRTDTGRVRQARGCHRTIRVSMGTRRRSAQPAARSEEGRR